MPPTEPTAALRTADKPPVKWATIREDASERGLFAVVDEAMIGRKLTPSRRKLIVGNIVMAVAKWRETFRDCGCWKTADGYALCPWHERMLQSQVAPLRAALASQADDPSGCPECGLVGEPHNPRCTSKWNASQADDPSERPGCICGRREPMAGMCFDIDGNWWNGHGLKADDPSGPDVEDWPSPGFIETGSTQGGIGSE